MKDMGFRIDILFDICPSPITYITRLNHENLWKKLQKVNTETRQQGSEYSNSCAGNYCIDNTVHRAKAKVKVNLPSALPLRNRLCTRCN